MDEFNSALDKIQELISKRNLMGSLWPFLEFLKDKSQPYVKTIDSWMEPIVERALEYKKMAKNVTEDEKNTDQVTFLEYLADNTEGAFLSIKIWGLPVLNRCVDMSIIRDQLKNILVASRDSVGTNQWKDHNSFNNVLCQQTSSLLTLTTYLMATHPNVMKRMREEVLENLGPHRFPTIEDIKTLKYSM